MRMTRNVSGRNLQTLLIACSGFFLTAALVWFAREYDRALVTAGPPHAEGVTLFGYTVAALLGAVSLGFGTGYVSRLRSPLLSLTMLLLLMIGSVLLMIEGEGRLGQLFGATLVFCHATLFGRVFLYNHNHDLLSRRAMSEDTSVNPI